MKGREKSMNITIEPILVEQKSVFVQSMVILAIHV